MNRSELTAEWAAVCPRCGRCLKGLAGAVHRRCHVRKCGAVSNYHARNVLTVTTRVESAPVIPADSDDSEILDIPRYLRRQDD